MIAAPTDSNDRCVWLAQCVCPNGHTIMAYANEAGDLGEAKSNVVDPLHQKVGELLREGSMKPTCAQCEAHAITWRFKASRTRFATMDEAKPYMVGRRASITAQRLAGSV